MIRQVANIDWVHVYETEGPCSHQLSVHGNLSKAGQGLLLLFLPNLVPALLYDSFLSIHLKHSPSMCHIVCVGHPR